MKKGFFILFLLLNFYSNAITLEDIKEPMPIMGRFSNSDKVEATSTKKETIEQITKKEIETQEKETEENENILSTFADLSLKKIAQDAILELNIDENKINSDLNVLWNATTERSETMKYTIYKLSNPDEDKPTDSAIKKILRPIANISSVAGASVAGDPYMATGALIGGGLLNAFMKDDKEINYKFSKVSDTDMVLLIRKIDDLQKKLLELYIDYKTKEQLFKMSEENFKKREEIFNNAQNLSKEELTIADVYYRNAKTQTQKAQDEFLTSRAILENLVGKEALSKIEED